MPTHPRDDVTDQRIQRVPWSKLGPEFVSEWGYADSNDPQAEMVEIVGMNGSGKTHFLLTILAERAIVRNTCETLIVTKQDDSIFSKLGWPIETTWQEARKFKKHRQVIFWPRTSKLGSERKDVLNAQVRTYLEAAWKKLKDKDGGTLQQVIAFDEIAYVESLSPETRDLIGMYWREARSMGINMVAMKQRPQGTQRDMHSESQWTVAFVPKDRADAERFAELFGPKQVWLPVFDSMDPDKHEFLIRHSRTREAFISWVDGPIPHREEKE